MAAASTPVCWLRARRLRRPLPPQARSPTTARRTRGCRRPSSSRGVEGALSHKGAESMLLWRSLSVIGSAALAIVFLSGTTAAQEGGSVTPLETMHVIVSGMNSDPASFDISWVDESTGQYFLADRTNNAVDQFDASHHKFVALLGHGAFHGTGAA